MNRSPHHSHDNHSERTHAPAHDKHAGHSVAMFRDKFWVSAALTIPILIWGHMLPRLFGYTPPQWPGADWIPPRGSRAGWPTDCFTTR